MQERIQIRFIKSFNYCNKHIFSKKRKELLKDKRIKAFYDDVMKVVEEIKKNLSEESDMPEDNRKVIGAHTQKLQEYGDLIEGDKRETTL